MILGRATQPNWSTSWMGARTPSWATQLRTSMSNLFSSSLMANTIVIVWPILTIPLTSDAHGPLPTCRWKDHEGWMISDQSQSKPPDVGYLNLHPALEVVAEEVGGDGIDHVDGERSEGDRFLVVVVPGAAQAAGLIPHFLHQRVVLNDDGVLNESTRWRWLAETTSDGLKIKHSDQRRVPNQQFNYSIIMLFIGGTEESGIIN